MSNLRCSKATSSVKFKELLHFLNHLFLCSSGDAFAYFKAIQEFWERSGAIFGENVSFEVVLHQVALSTPL
jgi:hypothetical protein